RVIRGQPLELLMIRRRLPPKVSTDLHPPSYESRVEVLSSSLCRCCVPDDNDVLRRMETSAPKVEVTGGLDGLNRVLVEMDETHHAVGVLHLGPCRTG